MFRFLPANARRVAETVILSLLAGGAAVLFLKATNALYNYIYAFLKPFPVSVFAMGSFVAIVGSSLVVCFLLRWAPEAAGSGIPQLKAAYWKDLGFVPWRPIFVKFIAGVASLGGGMSLGREGPTVYLCGGLASAFSGYLGKPKHARRFALTAGAAAGLAAAFNTPFAAITFVLEELVGDLGNRYLGGVVLASVTGALVVQASIGRQPAFILPAANNSTLELYLLLPLVAVAATLCGMAFDKGALFLRKRLKRQQRVRHWLLPLFGGLLTWCIAIGAYLYTGKIGVFGLGYGDLSEALANGIAWKIAGILTLAKIAATITGYSFGGCGGIFSPTLFIGGMCGFFIGGLGHLWMPITSSDQIILAGVGMCTCLCAVIRAPLTSMLIVFEMTHEFTLIPPLMIGVILCEAIARLAGRENFYTALLLQDGHELVKINPPRDIERWGAIRAEHLLAKKVVSLTEADFDNAARILDSYPFRCFPVERDGKLTGVVTRSELKRAAAEKHPPHIEEPVVCTQNETVRELADRFILSPLGILVVMDEKKQRIMGVLTLHDLLRAQAAVVEEEY